MNKKKIFLSAGALVLAVAGVIAGRASAKFAAPTALYFTTAGLATNCYTLAGSISSVFHMTTAGTNPQYSIVTAGGFSSKVFANSTCTIAVRRVP